MRIWWVNLSLLLLIVGSITASANAPPSVISATPGRDGSAIVRFTLRFSESMAPVGGGNSPLTMRCAVGGAGRWVDPSTFVFEFARVERLRLDKRDVGLAEINPLVLPGPGSHRLELVDRRGRVIDSSLFTMR
ncbi:MAG: alpha-2-macroglobulin [Alphaproteobacteria bacterium]|nr:alpha-2-macroglobulin [Alphaproteobacteria bacterium]